jgi:L-iditol 2-dehydrogenase
MLEKDRRIGYAGPPNRGESSVKALVLQQDKRLEYREVPMPEKLGPDSVLVRIAYCGICASDIKRGFGGGAYHYPLIMGHELSGVVEESFPGSRFGPGDRVTAYPLLPCRRCPPCLKGDYAQCQSYDYFGSRRHGGFAEYLYVPEPNLFRVPAPVQLLHAALTEPCAVALHGVEHLEVLPGHSGAVIGAGPIGNMVAQWLRLRGCSPVFAVDIEQSKLELAERQGFVPVSSRGADPVAAILERTGGSGVERVVEACGLPLTFLQALRVAARSGQVVFLGNIQGRLCIEEEELSSILRRELRIFGSWNSRMVPEGHNDWSTVLDQMDRAIEVAPLISHTPELAEGPEVFARLAEGRLGPHWKVVFRVRP